MDDADDGWIRLDAATRNAVAFMLMPSARHSASRAEQMASSSMPTEEKAASPREAAPAAVTGAGGNDDTGSELEAATGSAGSAVAGQWPSSTLVSEFSVDLKSDGERADVTIGPISVSRGAASPPSEIEKLAAAPVGAGGDVSEAAAFMPANDENADKISNSMRNESHNSQSPTQPRSIVAALSQHASQVWRAWRFILTPTENCYGID